VQRAGAGGGVTSDLWITFVFFAIVREPDHLCR
jgi:hypothetical protein